MSFLLFIKKYKPTIIVFACLIIFIIIYSTGYYQESPNQPSMNVQPSSIPPDFTQSPFTSPQQRYLEQVSQKSPLASWDIAAKEKILSLRPPGQLSGILYMSSQFSIEYVSSVDTFQVEILTANIAEAKTAATNWFRTFGVSDEGICNYPVSFYLNYDIKATLDPQTIKDFNPLPDGC